MGGLLWEGLFAGMGTETTQTGVECSEGQEKPKGLRKTSWGKERCSWVLKDRCNYTEGKRVRVFPGAGNSTNKGMEAAGGRIGGAVA